MDKLQAASNLLLWQKHAVGSHGVFFVLSSFRR